MLHCVQIIGTSLSSMARERGNENGVGWCPESHLAMPLYTSVSEQLHSILFSSYLFIY